MINLLAVLSLTLGQTASDTVAVEAMNAPVWGASPTLVEEVRIGVIDGDPHYTFGDISSVAIGPDSLLWVADRLAKTIRRFRPDGSYVDDVGRGGEGPGEFSGGMGLGLATTSGGRVAVYDPIVPRVTYFSGDGAYVRSWSAPITCRTNRGKPLVRAPDDDLLLLSCGAGTGALMWVRVDSLGTVQDTLIAPPRDTPRGTTARAHPFGAMPFYIPRNLHAPSPRGYLVTARSDDYALFWPLGDGRTVRISREWTPVEATRDELSEIARYLERSRERFSSAGIESDSPPRVPSTKPPLWAIQVDNLGRIWVARHGEGHFRAESDAERASRLARLSVPNPPMEWREPLVVDVIERTGRYLGTIRFPNDRATLGVALDQELWVVEHGDFDEQYLVRYRVVSG